MDIKDIKELIRFFDKSGVAELEIEQDEFRIYVSKSSPSQQVVYQQASSQMIAAPQAQAGVGIDAPAANNSVADAPVEAGKAVESPMIGTFYAASAPGAAPFAKEGDVIEKGQTLCIVEAMKIMNTIEAEFRCKILKVLVENGKPVEYGQPLFMVEPL